MPEETEKHAGDKGAEAAKIGTPTDDAGKDGEKNAPAAKSDAASEPGATVDKKGEGKTEKSSETLRKVLVVEDSMPLRRMLCKILESQKLQCFEAVDGEAAMGLIKHYKPEFFSLILTDLMMPKMDGVELIATLRKTYGAALPPIVICSSRSDRETVQIVAKLGAVGYILKPFKTELVIQKVHQALEAKKGEAEGAKKAEEKNKG